MDTEILIKDGKTKYEYTLFSSTGRKYLDYCKICDYNTFNEKSAIFFIKQLIGLCKTREFPLTESDNIIYVNSEEIKDLKTCLQIMELIKESKEASISMENCKVKELQIKYANPDMQYGYDNDKVYEEIKSWKKSGRHYDKFEFHFWIG